MKLMRLGPVGAERPVVRIDDTTYVDVSDVVADYDEAFFGSGGLDRLRELVAERTATGQRALLRRASGSAPRSPGPHQILCIGLNYSDHAAETGQAVPDEPILFTKSPNTLVGPERRRAHPPRLDQDRLGGRARHRDRPAYVATSTRSRRPGTRSPATCSSTTSASARSRSSAAASGRRASRPRPSTRPGPGSSRPTRSTTCWHLDMWLDVNGVRRQSGSTSTMIFDPYFIVHYLSQFLVLEPGDLINTGTPPGVGMGIDPPGLARPGRRDGAGHRRPRHPAPDRDRATLRCARSSSPAPAGPKCRRSPTRSPGRARSWSTSRASASAAPTSSSSAARWSTCRQGHTTFPSAPGHEWCGTVAAVGADVAGRLARPARHRRHHARLRRVPTLPRRAPPRVRGPVRDRHPRRLPRRARREAPRSRPRALHATARRRRRHRGRDGRARRQRAARRRRPPRVAPGERLLVLGTGTIGLLRRAVRAAPTAPRCTSPGSQGRSLEFARGCGLGDTWTLDDLPDVPFDAVIDATNARTVPALAVRPGRARPPRRLHRPVRRRRASSTPATIALKDVTAVGILGALRRAAGHHRRRTPPARSTRVRSSPPSCRLDRAHDALAGWRPDDATCRPQDPRRPTNPGDDMSDFDGLTALVTGGASGIGAATARLLRHRGAQVAIIDRAVAGDSGLLELSCDITDRAAVDAASRRRRSRSAASTCSSTTPASARSATCPRTTTPSGRTCST